MFYEASSACSDWAGGTFHVKCQIAASERGREAVTVSFDER